MAVLGFQEFGETVENGLGKRRVKKYSSRNHLHRRLLDRRPVFKSFVKSA